VRWSSVGQWWLQSEQLSNVKETDDDPEPILDQQTDSTNLYDGVFGTDKLYSSLSHKTYHTISAVSLYLLQFSGIYCMSGCYTLCPKNVHFFIICPIAIAYSMGQIIKSVCVCQCVCLCVRLRALSRSQFLVDFHQNWHRRKNPQKVERVRYGVNIAPPFPLFCPKPPF